MHYNFWSKLYFYMKFLEDVYFSVSTCIQNFSDWHALFIFYFLCFCSHCGMKWDTACRPTNDLFWAFLSPGAQFLSPGAQYLFSLGSWKKRSSKKDLQSQGPSKQLFMTLLFGLLTMWDWASLSSLLFCI